MGEEGVDVGKRGGQRVQREGGQGRKLTLGPFHHDEDTVNVAVHVGEEASQLHRERFQTFAEGVKFRHDERGRRHVREPDAFPQVPDGDAGFL